MRPIPMDRDTYLSELRRMYLGERRVGLAFLALGAALAFASTREWANARLAPVGWASIGVGWTIVIRVIVRRTRWAAEHRPEAT